jgi:hypothetical protein
MHLAWRQPDPPVITQWRGPDARVAVSALSANAPQLAALIGPPGLSPLSGRFVLTIGDVGGRFEHTQSLPAAGVLPTHSISLTLGPTSDVDENCAELTDVAALSGTAGMGSITVSANFLTPFSGPLILNWSAL